MITGMIITIGKEEFSTIIENAVTAAFEKISLKKETQPLQPDNDIMNVREVCSILDISIAGLYRKTHLKEIPFVKKGKKLLFSKTEILQWLKESEQSNNNFSDK